MEYRDEVIYSNTTKTPEDLLLEKEEEEENTKIRKEKILKTIVYNVFCKVLSKKEKEFLKVILNTSNCSYSDIAKKLNISEEYARTIKKRVERKIRSNQQLIDECRMIYHLLPLFFKFQNPFTNPD